MNRKVTSQPGIIALKDFRLHTQSYISKVAKGESFVVVKRSRPAFRLEPIADQWETVVDFTKINKSGVDAKEILSALE
jgi:prevent-host-death family protein